VRRLALALALLLAGCGGGAPAPVAFADYAAEGQAALCAWAVRCRHAPDDATCRRILDPRQFDTRRADDGLRLGRLAYDADAAGACLDAGRAAACSAPPFTDASCDRVFTGLVPQDGVCTTAFDCAGGARCLDRVCDAACCVGACGPPEPRPAPPLRSEVGGACATHGDCVDDAFCDIDGRCHAMPREPGERCLFGCYYGDLFCDVEREVCVRYGGVGDACGPGAPCNLSYTYCDGVCRPRPGPGEGCDAAARCVPGLVCAGGVCAPRGGEGEPCSGDDQCDVACDVQAGACVAYAICAP
jgi:hypothetical protein